MPHRVGLSANTASLFFHSIVLTLASAAIASSASAQLQVTVESITDRDDNELNLRNSPIGKNTDCDANTQVTLDLRQIPTSEAVIDVWRGEGDQNCADASNRDSTAGDSACDPVSLTVDTSINNQTEKTLTFTLDELVDDCSIGDGNYSIYFLATDTAQSEQAVDANASDVLQLTLDTTPPSPPSSVSGGSGDSAIPVSWDSNTGDDIREYFVYVDTSGCPVDGTDNFVRFGSSLAGTESSVSLDGSKLGIDFGASASVAIVAVDQALNESEFSSTVCAERVQTDGFCDIHMREMGKCSGCSVHIPGSTPEDPLPLAWAAILGWAAVSSLRRRGTR